MCIFANRHKTDCDGIEKRKKPLGEKGCSGCDGSSAGREPMSRGETILRAFGERIGLIPATPAAPLAGPAHAQPQPPPAPAAPATIERVMAVFDEGAKLLGTDPRGWLPSEPRRLASAAVRVELRRIWHELDRYAWPPAARRKLATQLQPGDRAALIDPSHAGCSGRTPARLLHRLDVGRSGQRSRQSGDRTGPQDRSSYRS